MLGLAYALSPAVGGEVEDFNVSLFRSAISIVILFTLLFQGVLTQVGLDPDLMRRDYLFSQVLTRPFREEGFTDMTTRRFLFLAARYSLRYLLLPLFHISPYISMSTGFPAKVSTQ